MKTVVFKSMMCYFVFLLICSYIILTNKENPGEIVDRCITANISSVVLDAIKKCIVYYKELGPDARVAVIMDMKNYE